MCEYSLRSGDEIEGAKGKRGGRYRLQALVYMHYNNQEWIMHCAPQVRWSGGYQATKRHNYFSEVSCCRFDF
jgi:hypothetical protein